MSDPNSSPLGGKPGVGDCLSVVWNCVRVYGEDVRLFSHFSLGFFLIQYIGVTQLVAGFRSERIALCVAVCSVDLWEEPPLLISWPLPPEDFLKYTWTIIHALTSKYSPKKYKFLSWLSIWYSDRSYPYLIFFKPVALFMLNFLWSKHKFPPFCVFFFSPGHFSLCRYIMPNGILHESLPDPLFLILHHKTTKVCIIIGQVHFSLNYNVVS